MQNTFQGKWWTDDAPMVWFKHITLIDYHGVRVMYDPEYMMVKNAKYWTRRYEFVAACITGRLHMLQKKLRLPVVHSAEEMAPLVRDDAVKLVHALMKYASKGGFESGTIILNGKSKKVRKPSRTPNRVGKNGEVKVPPLRYRRWFCDSLFVKLLVDGEIMESVFSFV